MIEFICERDNQKIVKILSERYRTLGYGKIRSLLRNKDISIDGVRIKENVDVKKGSLIKVYVNLPSPQDYRYDVKTVYEDDNLFVFNKPKGLETQGEISLESYAKSLCPTSCAVHRLDVNTDGVIMVAKNEKVQELLIKAIKDNKIRKNYLAVVYGQTKPFERIEAYLKKDSQKAKVKIFTKKVDGSVKIITEYKTLATYPEYSVVDVNLLTGRTHQIRAQFAYLSHPVLGDGKYGREEINSRFPYKKQALTAYKLIFDTDGELSYLKGKIIEIDCPIKDLI